MPRIRVIDDPSLLPPLTDDILLGELLVDAQGRLWTHIFGASGGGGLRLISFTVLTVTGGATYVVPAGITALLVDVYGSGGGGGGAATAATSAAAGSGGAGGGFSRKFYPPSIAASYPYNIAVGGAGGAAGNNNGVGAANTTFDTGAPQVIVPGGGGGIGSAAAATVLIIGGSLQGALPTGGHLNIAAPGGYDSIRLSATVAIRGRGGSAAFSGADGAIATTISGAGVVGNIPGGGGSGGLVINGSAAVAGGPGARGQIVVWEFGP